MKGAMPFPSGPNVWCKRNDPVGLAVEAAEERLFEHGLCLPSGSNLAESDRQRVIDIVRSRWPAGR